MVQKAEILVERFEQGITIRWSGTDEVGSTEQSKALAIHGTEERIIGQEIWEDLSYIYDKISTDKILVTVEYKPLED